MYPELDAVLRAHLSGDRAHRDTDTITQYYRSPGSSGYHEATRFVADAIRDAGADEIVEERFPLDGETCFAGRTMPPAWEPMAATLEIVEPAFERLISYADVPSTLPWWCGSTPDGGSVVQVVDVGAGLSEADYAGKPVAGNAVLIRDGESRPAWHHAAELARKHGAAGIITDFLHSQAPPWRTRQSVPEAVQLLRLPPRWDNPWAFSVGYWVAERLASLLRRGPVAVRAVVRARTFKGDAVNLIATLRGTDRADESVLFIAHTSAGTKPCANCAAGPSLMIELCRAFTGAIRTGALPRPRRSIRFMFVAEGLGSSFFLGTRRDELNRIQAALCLDSVGHRQAALKSSLVMYRSPDSIPSYVSDLGAALIEDLPKEAEWPFRNGPVIPLVNFTELPYTPWSDNHYWVTFGVPAPLFMSWPDLYFHTQLLTAEHTDPLVFERAGRVLGSLALGIARAGAPQVGAIMQEVASKAAFRLGRLVRTALAATDDEAAATAAARVRDEARYLVDRDVRAIRSTLRLADGDAGFDRMRALADRLAADLEARLSVELERLEAFPASPRRGPSPRPSVADAPSEQPADAARLVPHRASDAVPPGVAGLSYDETAALVAAMHADDPQVNWETLRIFADELWNFADGRRTLAEIARAVTYEFGFSVSTDHFVTLARGLEKAGQFRLDARPA
jgi:aminopeptidase YwaD